MGNYLRNFKEVSQYESYISGSPLLPNVSKIDEDSSIKYKTHGPVATGHNVGDICYWDGTQLAYTSTWTSELGTPLAVCVIPSSHNVYGNGKAGFMSIKGVNSDGSESTSNVGMEWGGYGIDTPLTNYTKVPTWDNKVSGSVGSSSNGYLSSDKTNWTGAINVIDTKTRYNGNTPYIPSPYAADSSLNTAYIATIEGNNALSDFNGADNTNTLAATGATYLAANACHLYSTNGIAAGQWYLPAMGELGYTMLRFNVINSALTACNGVLLDRSYYWSSTECNQRAYVVDMGIGYVDYVRKDYYYYLRPFTSLS